MQVYNEGTQIIIWWFEKPIIYDVCARPNPTWWRTPPKAGIGNVLLFLIPLYLIICVIYYLPGSQIHDWEGPILVGLVDVLQV